MAPSVSYSITARLEVSSHGRAVSEITRAVEQAGGVVTALDVNSGNRGALRVDVTCAATDTAHAESLVAAMAAISGVTVHKVSDRTFLLHLGGKIEMRSKVPLRNRDDLSMAYTPGVARVSLALAAKPEDARRLTIKRNSVAVVTDGSAVLGLGNVGPYAALPVMEGKAALFKRFANIDAWPICLDTQDVDQIVATVAAIAPGFGGINLEDISAPRCFEVERRLRAMLDIPVFHDDQHGTAIVVLAALTNALRVVGKELKEVKIVMAGAGDPVATGLVTSLARPGGNLTGQSSGGAEVAGKSLELIRELIPAVLRVGVLADDSDPFAKTYVAQISQAARSTGMAVEPVVTRPGQPLEPVFETLTGKRVGGLIIQGSIARKEMLDLAIKYRLPTLTSTRLGPSLGALASYGSDYLALARQSATYVDKILKGAKPADLPVAFPTKFLLIINQKTAKAIGVEVPPTLLDRADEVIE